MSFKNTYFEPRYVLVLPVSREVGYLKDNWSYFLTVTIIIKDVSRDMTSKLIQLSETSISHFAHRLSINYFFKFGTVKLYLDFRFTKHAFGSEVITQNLCCCSRWSELPYAWNTTEKIPASLTWLLTAVRNRRFFIFFPSCLLS